MKVVKFGGSSMADAGQYRKIREIINADPDRKVVVVSAAGKRFKEQTRRMAEQIEELNRVYDRMLQSMTVNMKPIQNKEA